MEEDPYWQRAEFLIARGYGGLQPNADVGKLAQKLRKADERNQDQPTPEGICSRDSVYGESAALIDKMMDQKAPIEKRLLRPYEASNSRRDLDKL